MFDNESVVQIRDDEPLNGESSVKANRRIKLERKHLKKLAQGKRIDGFLSIEDQSQASLLDTLKQAHQGEEEVTPSQAKRQEDELEEIDAKIDEIMEDLLADEDDEDNPADDAKDKSFSPSQPVLLSQKADLLQDALKQSKREQSDALQLEEEDCSDIDAILGVAGS